MGARQYSLALVFALCSVALLSVTAHAQSLPSAAAGPAVQGFSAELATSLDYFRGNTSMLMLGGTAYGRYRKGPDYAALYAGAGFNTAESTRLQNALRLLGRYRRTLLPFMAGAGIEVFSHFERSEPRRHAALFELGLGPTVQWFDSDKFWWSTTVGYAFEYEKFSFLTDPNNAAVVRDARGRPIASGRPLGDSDLALNAHRAWISTEVSYLIADRVRLAEDFIAMVPLDHCPCDTRIMSETALRVIATPHFSTQMSLSVLYDAAPARLVDVLDAIAKSSLIFTF